MKKPVLTIFLIILAGKCFPHQTVNITVGEWPPYLSEKMENGGILMEIISEAFSLEGIKAEYKFYPWKRAYDYVKEGKHDASPGWTKTPERETLFYFSDPVFISQGVFFHLKSKPFDWKTVDDLKKFKMGGTIGYNYGEMIQGAEATGYISMDRVATDKQNLKKLLAKRIDIFPQLLEVGYYQLSEYFDDFNERFSQEEIQAVTHHPTPYRTASYYLILSRENPENEDICHRFNKGLESLIKSGKYKQIFSKIQEKRFIKK